MMIAGGEQLFQYIPQRPPIVMIDKLEEVTESNIISGLNIKANNIFVENEFLREPGLIENIAQTIAAGAGFNQIQNGKPVALGFIAAVRELKINTLPKVGQHLKTIVKVINEVMDVTIVKGEVYVEGDLIAECEMRIFIQKT